MAGLMLASAFSVADAQKVVEKYETSKAYWLGMSEEEVTNASSFAISDNAGEVLAVVSNPSHPDYGQLILVKKAEVLSDICAVKAATWTITFTQPTDGTAPKFTYVNKATGLTLSLDPEVANADDPTAYIKGNSSEWLNTPITNADKDPDKTEYLPFAPLRSFYKANEAVYLAKGTMETDNNLFGTAKKENISYTSLKVKTSKNTSEFDGGYYVAPVQPMILPLDAKALNSQLGKLDLSVVSDDQKWFNLYFNQDVTDGAETNLFAATKLQAVQVTKPFLVDASGNETQYTGQQIPTGSTLENLNTPYVKLLAKDNKSYIVVDTAYHAGTESVGELPKFTYAKSAYEGTNNVARNEKSFEFAFAYDPFNDRVLIKSHGYYKKNKTLKVPASITGNDGNNAFTYWGYDADGKADNALEINDAYVRLAKLASVREMTVAAQPIDNDKVRTTDKRGEDGKVTSEEAVWNMYPSSSLNMATTVKMSQDDLTFTPATIADGLYLIKLHTSGYDKDGNKREEANGDYLIASLKGNFGYAEQAKNQDYDHMPAAQWYIEQNGTSTTAPITIRNREFFDQYGAVIQRMIAQVIGESDHIGEAFETILSRGKLGADEHHVGKSVFDQHIYDLLVL